jgi:DNA-directed RNA polymerase subunit F
VQGNTGEAEKILRDLMAHPTIMVSKEQATIELARTLSRTKPDEARKLLEPLRTERSAVSRMALTAYAEIGQSAPAAH